MAKVIFTAVVSDIKGKIAGNVFQGGPYGSIIRQKVSPVNKRSSRQLEQRQKVQYLTQQWQSLTEEQRFMWLNPTLPLIDSVKNGAVRPLSGLMFFLKVNLNMLLTSQPILLIPPTSYTPKTWGHVSLDQAPTTYFLTGDVLMPNVSTTQFTVFALSGPLRASAAANRQTYCIARIVSTSTGSANFALYDQYISRYGSVIPNTRIFMKVWQIDPATGLASLPQYASLLVAPRQL